MCGAMSQNRAATQVGARIQAGTSSEAHNQGETEVRKGTHTETLAKQHRQHTQKRTQSILPQFKIIESQFGEKAQQIYTEVEEINNYIESGEQRSVSIHTLQLLNKVREELNRTPLIISPKNTTGQQKFSVTTLINESPNRMIED